MPGLWRYVKDVSLQIRVRGQGSIKCDKIKEPNSNILFHHVIEHDEIHNIYVYTT